MGIGHAMKKLIPVILLVVAWPAVAADINGYTALYECREKTVGEPGYANCNVDVATYTNSACDQTITAAAAWSTINWSNNVICLDKGDHTAKGTLTLGSSGTSGTRKVLRYYRSGDTDDDPWNQSGANQAKVQIIDPNGQSYWVIHRLSMPSVQTSTKYLQTSSGGNIILNRMYLSGFHGSSEGAIVCDGCSNLTIQSSVIRDCGHDINMSPTGIVAGNSTNFHAVNNEIYNCAKQLFTWKTSGVESGFVVENNDLYLNSDYYTNCAGTITPSGDCSMSEGIWSTKSAGSSGDPIKVIHNRMWGMRPCDTGLACDGGGAAGSIFSIGGGANSGRYVLFQNNILSDAEGAGEINTQETTGSNNNSIIGNIFYHFRTYSFSVGGIDIYSCCGASNQTSELYLNTIIDSQTTSSGWLNRGSGTNFDVRCNIAIDSNQAVGSWGSGSQMDYNVYYGTTDSGETNKVSKTLSTRANSTAYSLNAIIRTTATPPADGTAGDFLYLVTTAGTSAGSPPAYCTTLGCTTTDGSMVVKAIRGPYSFYRKLRTSPEQRHIPYARVHASAPDYRSCPAGFASRTGIGIDNTQP